MTLIRWADITKEESSIIEQIATRVSAKYPEIDVVDVTMNVSATHLDKPLRLKELLEADEFDFWHDVTGIAQHLNKDTCKMDDNFIPLYTM